MSSGVFPAQTDDLERQILAALNDPLHQSNGSIYLVGGSSGGCLALWAMLQSSNPNVPLWNEAARLRIKAVVSLSGPSNLGDYTNPGGIGTSALTEFQNAGNYYTGTPLGTYSGTVLYNASPISLMSSATSSPPVMLYGTKLDPVPYAQANDMYNALINKFGNPPGKFTKYVPLNDTDEHAFHYWHMQNMQVMPSDCVSHQVITFLQANP